MNNPNNNNDSDCETQLLTILETVANRNHQDIIIFGEKYIEEYEAQNGADDFSNNIREHINKMKEGLC